MRPRLSPDGDYSAHMYHRRRTAPYLFNQHGAYKNWLHFFSIQRDRKGASVNQNTHFVLPWELEDTVLNPAMWETLKAHYVVHRMREWHPHWRATFFSRMTPIEIDWQMGFWIILPDSGLTTLAQWLANLKRAQRILTMDGLDREGVELLCRPHLIFNPSSPLGD